MSEDWYQIVWDNQQICEMDLHKLSVEKKLAETQKRLAEETKLSEILLNTANDSGDFSNFNWDDVNEKLS